MILWAKGTLQIQIEFCAVEILCLYSINFNITSLRLVSGASGGLYGLVLGGSGVVEECNTFIQISVQIQDIFHNFNSLRKCKVGCMIRSSPCKSGKK